MNMKERQEMIEFRDMMSRLLDKVDVIDARTQETNISVAGIDERLKGVEKNTKDLGDLRIEVSKNSDFRKGAVGLCITAICGGAGWFFSKFTGLL